MTGKSERIFIALLVVLLAVGLVFVVVQPPGLGPQGAEGGDAPVMASETGARLEPVAIAANVRDPYRRKDYPKTFQRWGADGVKRIDAMRLAAANKVALSRDCDHVDAADLSDQRSVPPGRIVIFVDCRNGARFYIDGADLADETAPASETAQMARLGDGEALLGCEKAVKARLVFPSSYRPKLLGSDVYRAPGTGNVVATIRFTAKNGVGIDIPQKARCVYSTAGMSPPEIGND